MTIQELLNTGRRKLFLAINPATSELVCFCPWSFPPLNPNPNSEGMLAKYPGLMDWLVVPDGPAVGCTEIVWKQVSADTWVNAAGDIRTDAEMRKLDGTWDREIPIHKA